MRESAEGGYDVECTLKSLSREISAGRDWHLRLRSEIAFRKKRNGKGRHWPLLYKTTLRGIGVRDCASCLARAVVSGAAKRVYRTSLIGLGDFPQIPRNFVRG